MNKGNLLIVDDSNVILKMLKHYLVDLADNIYVAEDGLVALKELQDNEIHCVICDIDMPRMNGIDVIKSIRKDGNNVPFIFYTANGNQASMMEAVKYGAFDFLSKPNLDGLEDVVSRGLKEGLDRNSGVEVPEDAYVSEYQKLLEQIKNNPND